MAALVAIDVEKLRFDCDYKHYGTYLPEKYGTKAVKNVI